MSPSTPYDGEVVLFHSAIWTIGQWIDPLANGALFTVGTIHSAITHRPTLARTIHQSVHCLLHICTVKYGSLCRINYVNEPDIRSG